jgi:colanic acid/amylovoran biosynthesis glycosyltransferase
MSIRIAHRVVAVSKSSLLGVPVNRNKLHMSIAGYSLVEKSKRFECKRKYRSRPRLIIYVGRLSSEKGVDLLPEISRALYKLDSTIEIQIIGDGELKEFVMREKCNENVHMVGRVSNDELIGHYNEARLTLIPSRTEGMPTVALESMLCGTPVLATPVGSLPDLIINDVNGYFIQDLEPQAIASKIVEILSSNIDHVSKLAVKSVMQSPLMRSHQKWNLILRNYV